MDPRNHRLLFATLLLAAALPAVALATARHDTATPQRPVTLRLQPVLEKLGLKLAGAPTAELKLGQRVRAIVVDPGKLAATGIRGTRAGAVVTIEAVNQGTVLPAARADDAKAAEKAREDAKRAAEDARGLAAKVSTGGDTAGAADSKDVKSIIFTPPPPSGTGIPTSTIE